MVPILFFLWRVTVKDSSVNNSVRPVSAVGGASTQWTPTGDACHAELHKYTLTYLNSLSLGETDVEGREQEQKMIKKE